MLTAVVQYLAERSERELLQLKEETRRRADFEIDQIDSALELRRYQDSLAQKRRPSPRGETRRRVLNAVRAQGHATPAAVVRALKEEGAFVSESAVHNMLGRLVRQRELIRVADGLYAVAPTNANGSATEER